MSQKYAFLDRDGTLIFEPQDTFQIDSIEKLKILDGVIDGLKKLQEKGFKLIMVTNQNGVGTASFPTENFEKPQAKLLKIFQENGVEFERIFVCPHLPEENCDCRKPKTGLLDKFFAENEVDLKESFVCGDRETDKELAEKLGIKYVPMKSNGTFNPFPSEPMLPYLPRISSIKRDTTETQISLTINLDGTGKYEVDTDIGFLNHMLELFAKHGLFDLKITARGDTKYDDHHLIEDIGIVLGQAIKQAAGDKKGIKRYGFMLLPMDEVLVAVATDLAGRYAFESNYEPVREKVNDFSTEMVRHFFKSLALNAEMNLHIQFLNAGENEHHRIEGIFKAFAKSLRMSLEYDERGKDLLPSTKGKL